MTAPGTPRERLRTLADRTASPGVLGEAALWIAAEEYPDLDVPAWLGRLEALGVRAADRIAPDTPLDAAAGGLAALLFDEEGFRGNAVDYYDPRNSFLNDVLERRLGIPITLSLVYLEVAARAGVLAHGIGLPGHFIVGLERRGERRLVDPFHDGRLLDEMTCQGLLQRVYGPAATLEARHLQPVTVRQILVRMLSNLKGIYMAHGDWLRALGAVDRVLLLVPDAAGEVRDRAELYATLGQPHAAVRDWEAYLRSVPEAADAERVRARLRAIRQVLGALN